MKALLKHILPIELIQAYRQIRRRLEINGLFDFDKRRFLKYAYNLNKDYTIENLRAKITFHYHSIEKGLSNSKLRLGFGKNALNELFWTLDEYIKSDYPTNDFRFQTAISVINAYIVLHQSMSFPTEWVEKQYAKYSKYLMDEYREIGGYRTIEKSELPVFADSYFKDLAENRYSVRDFGLNALNDNKVFQAICLASKSPSVCNRQSWKVRYIKSVNVIKDSLTIQAGLTGNGENVQGLIIITADKQYMNSGYERNQTYIDGGLFTMSMLYALTSLSIASCTLNACFELDREIKMRLLLKVEESEDFIAIIAIGSYPDVFKVAKSPKDPYKLFTTVIE